jgi:UDP-N-acetylmuramoyl-tripeptide--D-alanyl-D-alanine ligase
VINADIAQFARLRDAARTAGIPEIVSFGEREGADAQLIKVSLQAEISTVQARILGTDVTYKLGAPGRHVVANSLGVLAAAKLLGVDLALAALALAALKSPAGRGERVTLDVPGGSVLLIDESYNANPTSMAAALALLGQVPARRLGRRIAVLGDMLELGPEGAKLHAGLSASVRANAVDLVFCAGPLMKCLWDALPSAHRGGYAETAAALEPLVLGAIQHDDAVMVKGSLGSRMGPIVKALKRRYAPAKAGPASQG